MKYSSSYLRELATILQVEFRTYEKYLLLVEEEGRAVRRLRTEQVLPITEKRDGLYRELTDLQDRRIVAMRGLYKEFGVRAIRQDGGVYRLSNFIADYASSEEKVFFLPLIDRLRSLVEKCNGENHRLGGIVQFALRMLNGMVSLIWSTTDNVVKSYSRRGQEQCAYNPVSRATGVIKQA